MGRLSWPLFFHGAGRVAALFLDACSAGVLAALAVAAAGLVVAAAAAALAAHRWTVDIEPGTCRAAWPRPSSTPACEVDPRLLYWWFRLSGQAQLIKAGSYELEAGITPRGCWTSWRAARNPARRDAGRRLELPPGARRAGQGRPAEARHRHRWTMPPSWRSWAGRACAGRALLPRHLHLCQGQQRPEGAASARCAPWTSAWPRPGRSATPQAPLKTPDEALILASIVEKETGAAADRPLISPCSTTGCASACRCRPIPR
jgi:UPF0755 protein